MRVIEGTAKNFCAQLLESIQRVQRLHPGLRTFRVLRQPFQRRPGAPLLTLEQQTLRRVTHPAIRMLQSPDQLPRRKRLEPGKGWRRRPVASSTDSPETSVLGAALPGHFIAG